MPVPATPNESVVFADLELARRLERAEGLANAHFVEARARAQPGSPATWIEVAGAYAMFDTPRSPVTQTFGLGLTGPPEPADFERLEAFFTDRGAPTHHEVSPLAGQAVFDRLQDRGYRAIELTTILVRRLNDLRAAVPDEPRLAVRGIEPGEEALFADVSARGWSEAVEFADLIRDFASVGAGRENGWSFFAEWDGQPIATASLAIESRIAVLAGASTLPQARRRGAQFALLDARLRLAARRGCDLAMMGASPGSASQRNAERHGFRVAYTRVKWMRPPSL